jgi:hypothetical protein
MDTTFQKFSRRRIVIPGFSRVKLRGEDVVLPPAAVRSAVSQDASPGRILALLGTNERNKVRLFWNTAKQGLSGEKRTSFQPICGTRKEDLSVSGARHRHGTRPGQGTPSLITAAGHAASPDRYPGLAFSAGYSSCSASMSRSGEDWPYIPRLDSRQDNLSTSESSAVSAHSDNRPQPSSRHGKPRADSHSN